MDRVGSWGPVAVGVVLLMGACGDATDNGSSAGGTPDGGSAPEVADTDPLFEPVEPSSAPTTDRGSTGSTGSAVPSSPDRSDPSDTTPDETTELSEAVAVSPLVGTSWVLTDLTSDGAPVDISSAARPVRWTFSPDGDCTGCEGPMLIGSDGCNDVSWEISVDAEEVVFSGMGITTDMLCIGELHEVMRAVFGADSMRYTIGGDELEVRVSTSAHDIALTFASLDASDDPFPPTEATIVDAGEEGGVAFRLTWLQGWLGLELLNIDVPAVPYGSGFGEVMSPIYAERHDIGGRPYLVARMLAEVARAVYEPVGGAPIELELHDVADPAAGVVGEFIDDAAPEWSLVTYDASDHELHRFLWPAVRVESAGE